MTATVEKLFEASWVDVCPVEQMNEFVGVCAKVGNAQVAVFLVEGNLYALDNHDPFSEANVLSRGIVGDLSGELVVASPIYKQHFRLKDGGCLEDESVSLPLYQVRICEGMIQVEKPA